MSLVEADYETIMIHLKHAYRSMRRLMATSQDWTAKVELKEEFHHLRERVKEFARCQHGIGLRGSSISRSRRPGAD